MSREEWTDYLMARYRREYGALQLSSAEVYGWVAAGVDADDDDLDGIFEAFTVGLSDVVW